MLDAGPKPGPAMEVRRCSAGTIKHIFRTFPHHTQHQPPRFSPPSTTNSWPRSTSSCTILSCVILRFSIPSIRSQLLHQSLFNCHPQLPQGDPRIIPAVAPTPLRNRTFQPCCAPRLSPLRSPRSLLLPPRSPTSPLTPVRSPPAPEVCAPTLLRCAT